MMKQDDFGQYVSMIGPKIGTGFISIARAVMTSSIKAKLIELKDFEYTDPGYDYPRCKLDTVNRLKNRQIALLLE